MRTVLCFFLLNSVCQAAAPLLTELRNSPEVMQAEQPVKAAHCIIHIRDWHWVPYGYVAAELPADAPDSVVMESYIQHLNEVREVQEEHFRLLRRPCLSRIRTLYREGLTPDVQPLFRRISLTLWRGHRSLPPARHLLERPNVLSLGVPGRLIATGLLKDVRAADTDSTLALTSPIGESGRLRTVPPVAMEQREDHMVQLMRQSGDSCILILGGAHDLTDNVRRLGRGKLGLIVVTTKAYQRHAVVEPPASACRPAGQ